LIIDDLEEGAKGEDIILNLCEGVYGWGRRGSEY
jgi:hypothetical protein